MDVELLEHWGKCSNKARQAGAESPPTAHWLERLGCYQLMEVGDTVWELFPEEQDPNTGTQTEAKASRAEEEIRKSWADSSRGDGKEGIV